MPWEIRIAPVEGDSLGDCDEVIALLSNRAPDFEVQRGPSLVEQVKDFPDHPLRALVEGRTPQELDAAGWSHPEIAMSYQSPGLSIDITGFRAGPIRRLLAEVRGSESPLQILRSLVADSPWSVISEADNSVVDLSAGRVPQWE